MTLSSSSSTQESSALNDPMLLVECVYTTGAVGIFSKTDSKAIKHHNARRAIRYEGSAKDMYRLVPPPRECSQDPTIGETVKPAYCSAVISASVSVRFFGSHCSTTKERVTPRLPEPTPSKN